MIQRRRAAAALIIVALFVAFPCNLAHARIDAAQFQRDLTEISRHQSRSIGSAGYYDAAKYLQEQIAALPNVELRKHDFPVMVPVTESAMLELGGGRVERVYPFWPAHVRVNATPPRGITGNLVYASEGRYEQLRPASLRGQIAVVEAAAGGRWMDASYMGAKAILVLGARDTSSSDLNSHDLRIPVNLPRFYVPPGHLADDLRAGRLKQATLKAQVTWQRRSARNYYALVRPARKAPDGWDLSRPPAAIMFSVPYDASSLVPDLAPGASQAVQSASGLALLRSLSSKAWDRPVVVFFGGADSIQMLATRNMFLALGESPAAWHAQIAALDKQLATATRDLDLAQAMAQTPHRLAMPANADLIGRVVKIIDTDLALEQDLLFRARAVPPPQRTDEHKAELKRLEARQIALNRLKAAFQQNPSALAAAPLGDDAKTFLARTIARLGGGDESTDGLVKQLNARRLELNARIDLYHWLADATGRPREPEATQTDARLIELLIGVDLSDRGTRVGPMFFGFFQRISSLPQIQEYRDWFTRVQGDFPAIDLDPLRGARAPSTYLAGPLPLASELAQAWGMPGLSMVTLNDLRLRRDTPADTLDRIDVDAILPQLDAVTKMFARAAADKRFVGPSDIKRLNVHLTGQVVSSAPGKPVPDLPRPGFLATYSYVIPTHARMPQLGALAWATGVRRTEVRDCDAEGNYRFEGLPRLRAERLEGIEKQQADMQVLAVQVYRIDARRGGAITATTDLAQQQSGDILWWVDIRSDFRPLRSLVFNCEEFTLTRLYDPRFLQTLGEVVALDARRNAEPKRFNMMMAHQMLAGFLEPGTPSHLLVRYGRVGNRLVLLNMSAGDDGTARGYTPRELSDLGPLALQTSRDFHRLDQQRLDEYRRAGVSATLLDDLHADAARQIDLADKALRADDGAGLIRNANGAWANEARVYHAAQNMARDVIRAAIFLLMLCVPFSFCMERLLIGTSNVYKQIAGMSAIFCVMTLALWSFHPAFQISASPLIIILAFAIILMSCVVIVVIYNKFDAELKRLRSGRGAVGGVATSFASAGVLMSAVLLGIANMRRRKFRTMLTSITIVLITFAVLCFTSTTRYVSASATPTGITASHHGMQLRQRGFRPIPEILPDQLRAVLADPKLKLPATPKVVERWWAVSTSEPNEQYNITAASSGKTIAIPAVLGLSPGESSLSRIAETIGPGKFARLEQGERDVIYLADDLADRLAVREGETVRIGGIDLKTAGVFPAKTFDDAVRTLSGDSLAPLKYSAGQLDAGGRKLDDTEAESLEVGGDSSEAGATYEFLPSSDFVIVPAEICRRLHKSTLRSVAFKLDDEQQTKAVADELARRFSLAMFAGYDDGVRMITASNLASVSGAAEVAVPLLVAGLIIFNTMMGSIAERKREIHVYTSLGLAPAHVGALFVAEAMTYGLIGSVFGYVIGQGVGTLLLKLGWLGEVTLNYSGSSAMLTMGLILMIVLLSALVPARLASKLAAPSIDRTWKVPEPHDGRIVASLPFTINQTAAEGVLAYLREFFNDHREGTIGKFSSGNVELLAANGDGSATAERGLKTSVWLTPFDLGIRQNLTLKIEPGAFPEIYEVRVILDRLSGDDTSWHRMNRTFLTELRKQFLQWRSLPPARMLEYVEMSRRLTDQTT
jgi:ABC-type lipoprotein release transport system permease subunit